MKEDDTQPLEAVTDEVMEARIVAWVLGEASAFEIAELERLCAEKPELEVFHRRMLALQGLLVETVGEDHDDTQWKLPENKRQALDETLGGAPVPHAAVPMPPLKRKRSNWQWAGAATGIAASLASALIVWRLYMPERESGAFGALGTSDGYMVAKSPGPTRENLEAAIREQEDKVGESRKALSNIVREKQIVYRGSGSIFGNSGVIDDDAAPTAADAYTKLEQNKIELESQIKSLLKYDSDQLMTYASGLDLPENIVKTLYPQYLDTKRELDAAKTKGLADNHPEVQQLKQQTAAMKKDLDAGVVNLRDVLRARLEMSQAQLAQVEVLKDQKTDEAITRGIDTADYVASKRQYQADLDRLAALKRQAGGAGNLPGTAGTGVGMGGGMSDGLATARKRAEAPTDIAAKAKPRAVTAAAQALAENAQVAPASAPVPFPAEPSQEVSKLMTGGLRSGDQMVTPRNIDSILNDPVHPQDAPGGLIPPQKGTTSELDDPIRTNPALTYEHTQNMDAVRRGLFMAEGSYNLGKYDDAKKEYDAVLRNDPYNSAARSGLERLATARSDYYRAAYDHTRAELLAEVDKAWELSVPAEGEGKTQKATSLADLSNPLLPLIDPAMASAPTASALDEIELLKEPASPPLLAAPVEPVVEEQNFDEIHTAEEAFSTFSLNVSDVSFQLAKAALERGGQPEPDSIKVEQFYNAVDYGDPSPESNEPVAGVVEQSAHPLIPGRNLVRLGIRTAAAGRAKSQPLRLTLLIDQSGSMVREDRKAAMMKAIDDLSGLLTDADQVSAIGFSRTPKMLMESAPGKAMGGLKDLINPEAAEGGTNLEEAMKLARSIASRHKLEDAQNRIVLFTDGAANLGDADPQRLSELVKAMRNQGLAFDVAGIGADGLNDQLLANLARHGNGRYYVAADNLAAQLAGAFRPAAEDVKVQVKFNPERVSRYKLIGFEESRLKTEDFRNDSVDAAELSAEEAAVAVYQVELIPGGQGVIGEMNVRFRDAGSGEIVERGWTIPHDDATPAFDRASPSMQLAGLSMLAGQKLRGGPLADAIQFKDLTVPIAKVKQYYSGSSKVSDMLRVVGLLSK